MASFVGTVYLTSNNVNGKIYIGLTSSNNPKYLGSGSIFKKALKKHGKANFTKVILKTGISCLQDLNYWEDFYIKMYNSTEKSVGYNMRPGGKNGGWRHNEESILKITTRSNKEDNKTHIREIQKKAVKARAGLHHSKESKLKMVNTKFGKLRKIDILDMQGNIINCCDFISEASKFTGVSESSIKNNLCGLSISTRRYTFKYKEIN